MMTERWTWSTGADGRFPVKDSSGSIVCDAKSEHDARLIASAPALRAFAAATWRVLRDMQADCTFLLTQLPDVAREELAEADDPSRRRPGRRDALQ